MPDDRRVSRRTVLRGGLASLVAAPGVFSSRIAAAGRAGPNQRVGVGFIGTGRRARQLMELPADAQIVAVCDLNLARAEEVAAALKCRAYQDYRQLLEARDVDAVMVATPDHWHALPSIHACQAGKDVYCEKPLSLTIVEGRRMVEAARKYDRVFQTGSQQRTMAANRLACSLVRDGGLGVIRRVVAHNYPSPWECALSSQPAPSSLDWDAWCGPTPFRPYHEDIYQPRSKPGWISFRPYSGGEMTAWGAHGLDQVQCALAMDESGPVEVWTEGEAFSPPTFDKPAPRTAADAICSRPKIFCRYSSGVVLELGDGPAGGARFEGAKGTLEVDRGRFVADPPELAAEIARQLAAEAGSAAKSDTAEHLRNWIDCIKTRRRPNADVEIGHRSATLCHLGNIARWTRRRLRWDPQQEQFIDDAEANLLLDRQRRKNYQLPDQV